MEEKWLKLQLRVKVPENITDKELLEWVRFNIGLTGSLSNDNPLVDQDLDPNGGWVDIDI
ncbi:MAG: hypothetical protein GY820_38520 [Gammaproteobacteria bacterium]|nr:hypothetical protein [Gammaproteobacteria bacterium]